MIDEARGNGAEITRAPQETFYGGYAGSFATSTAMHGRSRITRPQPGYSRKHRPPGTVTGSRVRVYTACWGRLEGTHERAVPRQ